MLTKEMHHPDMLDWEVEEDLQQARLMLRSRMRTNDSSNKRKNPFQTPVAVQETRVDSPHTLARLGSRSHLEFTAENHTDVTEPEPKCEYPPSPQGGWRPWIFAITGLTGGNIAMSLGGISPKYLPTIIIAEVILGLIVCIAFKPRQPWIPANSSAPATQ